MFEFSHEFPGPVWSPGPLLVSLAWLRKKIPFRRASVYDFVQAFVIGWNGIFFFSNDKKIVPGRKDTGPPFPLKSHSRPRIRRGPINCQKTEKIKPKNPTRQRRARPPQCVCLAYNRYIICLLLLLYTYSYYHHFFSFTIRFRVNFAHALGVKTTGPLPPPFACY